MPGFLAFAHFQSHSLMSPHEVLGGSEAFEQEQQSRVNPLRIQIESQWVAFNHLVPRLGLRSCETKDLPTPN